MQAITIQVDDDTHSELSRQSLADGRSVEELAALSIWQGVQRSMDSNNVEVQERPSRIPLVLNIAVTSLIGLSIIIQLVF